MTDYDVPASAAAIYAELEAWGGAGHEIKHAEVADV